MGSNNRALKLSSLLQERMKFRGKMIEQVAIKKFYTVIGTISKIAKLCVLRLNADKMFFILTDSCAGGSPSVWCQVEQENFFNEYNIEGVTKEQNEIYLELAPEKVLKSLSAIKSASTPVKSLKVKLTKKNSVPCLTFDVEQAGVTGMGDGRVCVQDIPVSVLPRKVWGEYSEPPMPHFDVSICLPELKKLRHVCDRFKVLGQAVTVTAGKAGTLSLKVESDEGVFSTHYTDLRAPVFRDDTLPWRRQDSQAVQDPNFTASVRVDLKRLSSYLSGEQLQPKRAIANIVEGDMLHMFFLHDDLLIQYFVPATSKL